MGDSLEQMSSSAKRESYTFDEAFKNSTNYFNGDEMAARIWIKKYALKDSQGNLYEKTPDDMHERLANEISRAESKYPNAIPKEKIYELIKDFKYLVPQGGPMTGIGNEYQVASLSNCFVIGNKGSSDSYGGIMKIDQEQVQLMKRRGGVGHDLSHIRPSGSPVKNSALTSTGVVPFMERYSNSTKEVAQDGRRGALMLSISMKHPDAEKFIDAKLEQGKVTGANVSVKIDDDFMKAVRDGKEYVQMYPVDAKLSSDVKLENLEIGKLYRDENISYKKIDAKGLWKKIVHNAWKSAEPGILFWDTIINESVPDSYADEGYKTISTNPCGEIPLCPYDSCRLFAINLFNYVENPFTPEAKFDKDKFKEHVNYAQRMSDSIIDLELEKIDTILNKIEADPEDEEVKRIENNLWKNIRHTAKEARRNGLGITGEGDMLAAMNLKYGSEKGINFSEKVHKTIAIEAYRTSVEMAKERGAFKIYDAEKEKDNPFINRLKNEDPKLYEEMVEHGRRNIALLTIAPTGTTSMMTQTSSGLENVFLPAYKRRTKVNPNDKDAIVDYVDKEGIPWQEHNVFHHKFVDWMKANGHDVTKKYDDKEIEELIKESPYFGATSKDIDWVKKVEMQGKIQKWVDHSISVTVNLPEDVSEELVGDVYMKAWENGCKGITVYREGSRQGVMISNKDDKKDSPRKRPDSLDAVVERFKNFNKEGVNEDWISFVGLDENKKPFELFTGKDDPEDFHVPKYIEKGKIVKSQNKKGEKRYDFVYENKHEDDVTLPGISHQFDKSTWNYAIMISGMLRNEMPIEEVVDIISKLKEDNEGIHSWKSGANRALKGFIKNGTKANGKCPECGQTYVYQEGCKTCGCGSKCE